MSIESGLAHPAHTVLVVEDNDDSRDALALLLEVDGFRVTKAPSATAALGMLQIEGLRPCLILLDLVLPELSGLHFARHLRSDPELRSIPVAALTGHEGQRREAERAGVFTVTLLKPTDIGTLLSLVGKHCPRSSQPCDDGADVVAETGTGSSTRRMR